MNFTPTERCQAPCSVKEARQRGAVCVISYTERLKLKESKAVFMDMCLGDKSHKRKHRDSRRDSLGGGYPRGSNACVIGRGRKGILGERESVILFLLWVVNGEHLIINT